MLLEAVELILSTELARPDFSLNRATLKCASRRRRRRQFRRVPELRRRRRHNECREKANLAQVWGLL